MECVNVEACVASYVYVKVVRLLSANKYFVCIHTLFSIIFGQDILRTISTLVYSSFIQFKCIDMFESEVRVKI